MTRSRWQYISWVRQIAIVLAAIVALSLRPLAGQAREPSVVELVDAATRYVASFIRTLSNVVADERYTQNVTGAARRNLRADFLLVRPNENERWLQFRDVIEVDGQRVESRASRLVDILTRQAAEDRARLVFQESARYNIGPLRTFNLPLFALGFLQPSERGRFTFDIDKRDRDAGENVWSVKMRERTGPTAISSGERDVPAAGRLWIDANSGQVVRTELLVEIGSLRWTVTTSFTVHPDFPVLVPREMIEQCERDRAVTFTGRAAYTQFRRFTVGTNEVVRN
jgi:hypothetical protein